MQNYEVNEIAHQDLEAASDYFRSLANEKIYYINWRSQYGVETVDETNSKKDAEFLVQEYNMAYGGGCYISDTEV